jgi:Aegerolysin
LTTTLQEKPALKNRPPSAMYEYLQVQATVRNMTGLPMTITGSDLSWGKWMQSPVDVPAGGSITFSSQGRDSSPSGTEGWASWKVGNANVTVDFSCPLHGSNSQSIGSDQASVATACNGTGGNVNTCVFYIMPPA